MNAAAPQPKENMGAPAPRYDARLKVTGEARYPADVPMTNPAFAFLVTSSIAKGRLQSLDLAEARTVPGVIDILTQDDASALHSGKFGHGAATSIDQLGQRSRMMVRSSRWCLPTATRRPAKRPIRFMLTTFRRPQARRSGPMG